MTIYFVNSSLSLCVWLTLKHLKRCISKNTLWHNIITSSNNNILDWRNSKWNSLKKIKLWSVSSSVGNFKFPCLKCQVFLLRWCLCWNNWFSNQNFSRFRFKRNWGKLQTTFQNKEDSLFIFGPCHTQMQFILWVSFCTEMQDFAINYKETKYTYFISYSCRRLRWP